MQANDSLDCSHATTGKKEPNGKSQRSELREHDSDEFYPTAEFYNLLAQTEETTGIPPRKIPFLATNLAVHAKGSGRLHEENSEARPHGQKIRTLLDAFLDVGRKPFYKAKQMLTHHQETAKVEILRNINVSILPGESLLVLGRPGSGCSTFLRAFANQLSLDRVHPFSTELHLMPQTSQFGNISSADFKNKYPHQAVYLAEDDFHYALLSVSKTLEYANEFSTPDVRGELPKEEHAKAEEGRSSTHSLLVPGPTREAYVRSMVHGLLSQFGILHVANSIVGDAFVRGVSGGERKRVSIAEFLSTRASFLAFDQATKGLDANTALEFAQNIRHCARMLGATIAVSLYQASDTVYECFDKVLVLDHGRQVYFGPAKQAREYFIGLGYKDLPRNSTADYLVNITDEKTRSVQTGRSVSEVPQTARELEEAYFKSEVWHTEKTRILHLQSQLASTDRNDFENGMRIVRGSRNSTYTVPFYLQLKTLLRRQVELQLYNIFGIIISALTAIIIAILIGTVYYKSPNTPVGAQSKAGLLFTMLLYITLQAFNELPMQMLGRPLMFKQIDYGFYRASALSFSSLVADIPITFAVDVVFSIMIYFMGGLTYNGGAFFTFFAIIYAYHLASMSMFRTVGAVCPNFDVTSRLATLFIPNMVLYSGYFLQEPNMRRWSFWISYIFPLRYAFDGLLSNEFYRTTFFCNGDNVVPSGEGYPSFSADQICNIPGAIAGHLDVPGRDYIKALYGIERNVSWRNFGLLIVYLIGLQLIQMYIVEHVRVGGSLATTLAFKKGRANHNAPDTFQSNRIAQDAESMQKHDSGEEEVDDNRRISRHRWPLTFKNMTYEVGTGKSQVNLLDGISGYVRPGTLTALMGVSGAGKTTLLDVLSKRKIGLGKVGGTMLLGGKIPSLNFQRGTAYVEQQDIHEPTATVREALRFSAYLRQPYDIPISDKDAYVEYIIDLLELNELANAQIGAPGTGIGLSAEARKRVTMGVELSAKPDILIFLDEPTSGQDGQSAFNTVRFLKKLAARGQAVLCTIHQPNALLFESFDRALILAKGGKCVYFGELGGTGAPKLVKYFEMHGATKLPDKGNPAEWVLDQVREGSGTSHGSWSDIWKQSTENAQIHQEIEMLNDESLRERSLYHGSDEDKVLEYATPIYYQLRTVTHRMFVSSWRSPDYGWTRAVATTALAGFTAICFWQLGQGILDMRARIFSIFMIVVLIPIAMVQIEPAYNVARDVFYRESSAKMYQGVAFGFAVVTAELPFSIVCAILFFVTLFYPVHFHYGTSHMGYQFLMTLLGQLFATTLGQAVSAITPNMFLATLFNPLFTFIFLLFCGVTIPYQALPSGWRFWMYYLNPATYIIGGMTVVELHDLQIQCKPSELLRFPAPDGKTCIEYAENFLKDAGGYLNNNISTDGLCEWCQYRNGEEYYSGLHLNYDQKWRDVGIVILFILSNLFIVFLGVKFLNFNKR